jgi:hypothetical protein
MNTDSPAVPPGPLVFVRWEASGQVTAELVGLPELHATAPTRDQAIKQLQQRVGEAVAAGQLAALQTGAENRLLDWFGYARDDPEFAAYVEEIRRQRQQLDGQVEADGQDKECSGSSSTPTT